MTDDFSTVTELEGNQAHLEQLRVILTRYELARRTAGTGAVLEAACGSGRGLAYLAETAERVVGGDYTMALVEAARRHYQGRIPVLRLDAHRLPFADASFDAVLCFEALYYFADADAFFREARRVLRPGGKLVLSSSNREWEGCIPSPYSTRYLSALELEQSLSKLGFKASLYAGFPAAVSEQRGVLSRLRRLASRSGLMPKTMVGKAFLKRLFYGPLRRLGPEIDTDIPVEPLIPWSSSSGPVLSHKLIYAVAERE
ncbi:MAG: hypothetical protein CO113_14155 [Elusimicrobia bacterium CG_4_9_14_3_um_filter_62_55]|nr:MAG: hypothetical protein COR54_19500 [Elusimicrobia bacterium CG22_combo_CG10-13_8_21_14_all_63_91]PJB24387.1 MAG: hypothetical protein CO113_14155 [Elusimicrobia bacterium CG_4_9_14_3_um_filter_62_55]